MADKDKTQLLMIPDVRLQFEATGGAYRASLVLPNAGVAPYAPLLEYTRKNANVLLDNTTEYLLDRGVAGHFDPVKLELKVGGKSERTSGGELGASGNVKAVDASGKLTGGRTSGGEASSGISTTYHPQSGNLSREDQAYMKAKFNVELLGSYQQWVQDNRAILRERQENGEKHPTIKVAGVTFDDADLHKLQKAIIPKADAAKMEVDRIEQQRAPLLQRMFSSAPGYDDPANPYARMYAANLDAVTRDPSLRGNASPQDVASALTFAASQQRIDPAATLTLRASADGAVHGMVAGGVDPAASRLRVDPANLVLPTQEQLAQAPLPATQDDPARQARMSVG